MSARTGAARRTVADVIAWLELAPTGTLLPVAGLLEQLRAVTPDRAPEMAVVDSPTTWRERLWTVPPETRLGVPELAEAIGRPKSWVYRHCSRRSGLPLLPHRKLDGETLFVVGEIRRWVAEHEEIAQRAPGPALSMARRRTS